MLKLFCSSNWQLPCLLQYFCSCLLKCLYSVMQQEYLLFFVCLVPTQVWSMSMTKTPAWHHSPPGQRKPSWTWPHPAQGLCSIPAQRSWPWPQTWMRNQSNWWGQQVILIYVVCCSVCDLWWLLLGEFNVHGMYMRNIFFIRLVNTLKHVWC